MKSIKSRRRETREKNSRAASVAPSHICGQAVLALQQNKNVCKCVRPHCLGFEPFEELAHSGEVPCAGMQLHLRRDARLNDARAQMQ